MTNPVSIMVSERKQTQTIAIWGTLSRRQRRAATKWWWSNCARTGYNYQEQWLLINNAKGVVN
jgi:hypothetical protein